MRANSASSWVKRWGLWILLVLAAALVVLCWLFPVSRRGKPKILEQAKKGAVALKAKAATELKELSHRMAARKKALRAIIAIEEEAARLKALAEYANRRAGK